jgi:hypothetical protein
VRFCLPCSATATRLVARTAPALERERAQAAAASTARRARKVAAQRAAGAAQWTVRSADGESIELFSEMCAMLLTPELRGRREESGRERAWRPDLTVRRGSKEHVTGHCDVWGDITLTVGSGAAANEIREVLLHELVHAVTVNLLPRTGGRRANAHGREWHGALFRRVLCRAAGENFGVRVHPDDHREAYGLDRLIIEQMSGSSLPR